MCAIALLALASSASAFGFFGHPSAAGHHGMRPGFRQPYLQAPHFRRPAHHHHHAPRQQAPAKRDSVQEFDDRFELYVTPSTDMLGRRFGFDVRYGSGADSVVVTEKRRGGFKQEYRIPESVQKEDISTHYNEANQLVVVFPKQNKLEDQPVASTGAAQASLAEALERQAAEEQRLAEEEEQRQYEEEQRLLEQENWRKLRQRQQQAREAMFARKAEQNRQQQQQQRAQQQAERQRLAREEAAREQHQAKAAAREEKYQQWKQAQAEKEQKQRVLREFNGKLEELQRAVRQWAEEPEQDSDLVVEDVPISDAVPKQEDAVSGYYFLGEFVEY